MRSLTPMQAASWVGRQSPQASGGVAAHLYAEFDGAIDDIPRFQQAVDALYARHPMLRLRVSADGRQQVAPDYPPPGIDDFRRLPPETLRQRLAEKRQRMSHQQLLLEQGYPCEISLTRLPAGRSRLHIDLDMIAADAESFRILAEDLARFYEDPPPPGAPAMKVGWFRSLEQRAGDRQLLAARERDREWWRQRLAAIPPAPPLACPDRPYRSRRLAVRLDASASRALRECARRHHLTLSALFLSLFTLTVAEGFAQRSLRISVPTFFRDPQRPGDAEMIGDFSDLLLFSGELRPDESLLQHCRRTMAQLHDLLSHGNYSGVSVMRDLSRLHGSLQYSPLVFTAGFGIRGGALFSGRVDRRLGTLAWVISQGPQVALDAQAAWLDDEILLNWDVRADAFAPEQPPRMFARFHSLAKRLAAAPQRIDDPVAQWLTPPDAVDPAAGEIATARPLTPLQQAYLLGRSEQWPLGGVAMHDFRTFRGRIDPPRFRQRLAELIDHFAALRTCIDDEKQRQYLLSDLSPPLEEIDLRDLSAQETERRVRRLRRRYQQICHDPAVPPWRIILIALPGGGEYLVFTSFDALILDGQGISQIIARLFDQQPLAAAPAPAARPMPADERARDKARAWWQARLADAVTPPRLPWRQPLAGLMQPRWRREVQTLDASSLKKLTRIGAAHGLFANSLLSAIVLDTLALWADDETLLVGVPVAMPANERQQPGNLSTFIAVRYTRGGGALADHAQRLQEEILSGLEKLAWSGVDLARQLTPRDSRGPALPVILTNCMNWETLPVGGPVRAEEGLTQTPQVALDLRLMPDSEGNLRLVADYVTQALPPALIREVLAAIRRRMRLIVGQGSLAAPIREALHYPHYLANTSPDAAVAYDFLGRIAARLFAGEGDGTALICGATRWSWRQLGERVASVANGLRARLPAPGGVAAIYLPRGPEHIVVTLACALTGIVRVPLDRHSPAERIRYLLENCRPDLLIADDEAALPGAVTPQALATNDLTPQPLADRSDSEQPAYYLYTSGSTGKPKCVVLNNRATANVLGQTIACWRIDAGDVFISVTPLHHDMSVFDLFAALSVGATLVLPSAREEKDAASWAALVEQHRVTLWCSVPAILEMLLDCATPQQLASLRLAAQGGDYIKPAVIRRLHELHPELRLVSLGGPTETTIWSIWHDITPGDTAQIPYGRPLAGNRYFICHDSGEHCPCGVPGRIHTAGVNLACGYLENGQLAQHDFVEIIAPDGEPVRTFRTGDIGYYRPDGVIMFAARITGYVKIRGIRVSLAEIEEAFRRHEAIEDIVVLDYAPDGIQENALGAVWIARGDAPLCTTALRAFARRYLPDSHIPGRFIQLPRFPLSANGKVDRHALRAGLARPPAESHTSLPTRQRQVLEIYCAAIGRPLRPEWDAQVPFIVMGLKLVHLQTVREKINAEFGVTLSGQDLLKCRNVIDVCALLR